VDGLKIALIIVGALLIGFVVAGIIFANLRLFLWIGIVGLVIYAIYGMVAARRSS
jgi:hypothetical protein